MITKQLIQNIVPDNLKDIELYKVTVDAFMEYMTENAQLSLDVANIYNENNPKVYEEILKIYANYFFRVIEDAKLNQNLQNEIVAYHKKFNIDYDVTRLQLDLKKFLSFEDLRLLKLFQQSKGNTSAMEYIYSIFNKIQFEDISLQSESDFSIEETGNPLEYKVNSNMIQSVFEQFVKPLAHPVGWKYVFTKITELAFKEYLFSIEIYDFSLLQINGPTIDNFKTNRGYLFETDAKGSAILLNGSPKTYKAENKDVLQVTRFGKYYPVLDLDSEINLIQEPGVTKVIEESIDVLIDNQRLKTNHVKITFKSGEILEQYEPYNPDTKKPSLILYYGDGPNDLKQTIKKDYSPYFSDYKLNYSYNTKLSFTLLDNLGFGQSFGYVDSVGTKVTCGSLVIGSGIKSNQTELPNITDYNKEISIANQPISYSDYLKESIERTRQVFKGIKYKYPRFFVYLDLTRINKDEFPLSISLNDTYQSLDYDYHHTKIVKFEGFTLKDNYVLETGYSQETYNLKIYSSNSILLEEVEFNLIPRIKTVKTKQPKDNFNFEVEKSGYSRDAIILDESYDYPEGWDKKYESYQLAWDSLEYAYYAEVGQLSQYAKTKSYVDSYNVFNYKPPRYYSNLIGHFIVSPLDYGYSQSAQKIYPLEQNPMICYDDFDIEVIEN